MGQDIDQIKEQIEYEDTNPLYYTRLFELLKTYPLLKRIKLVQRELRGTEVKLNFRDSFFERDLDRSDMVIDAALTNIEDHLLDLRQPESNLMVLIWYYVAVQMASKLESGDQFLVEVDNVKHKLFSNLEPTMEE